MVGNEECLIYTQTVAAPLNDTAQMKQAMLACQSTAQPGDKLVGLCRSFGSRRAIESQSAESREEEKRASAGTSAYAGRKQQYERALCHIASSGYGMG